MRLDPVVRDYESFIRGFIETLESRETRLYLDTSVLMWLIRLGRTPCVTGVAARIGLDPLGAQEDGRGSIRTAI
jgi:hypothetical protein